VVALAALVWGSRSESPDLLKDTDTVALLNGLEAHHDPAHWFTHDWPLENHFYRPVSTLVFYFDWASGGSAAQFGRTNALLASLCVLLAFWLFRELTDSPWMTGVASALFAAWHLGPAALDWARLSLAWLAPLCLLGVLRGGLTKLLPCALASLGCLFLASQVVPVAEFDYRIVGWLPGRTASVMTVFALVSLAYYARFVRTTAVTVLRPATATDLPATKSTVVAQADSQPALLVVLCCLSLLLALGSYEQAVMVPALLFGVWLLSTLQGRKSAWWPHVAFWAVLGIYLVLRARFVPGDASGYQEQQFRTGPGVWIALGDYLLPGAYLLFANLATLTDGALLLLTSGFWSPVLTGIGNVTTYLRAWTSAAVRWPLFGHLLLAFVAFLPMAWLHPFGHYHYLPSVFRAGYAVVLALLVARLVASAASLPELRAPARHGPAPGSLLRQ
jgi:hypothetical protein